MRVNGNLVSAVICMSCPDDAGVSMCDDSGRMSLSLLPKGRTMISVVNLQIFRVGMDDAEMPDGEIIDLDDLMDNVSPVIMELAAADVVMDGATQPDILRHPSTQPPHILAGPDSPTHWRHVIPQDIA